MLQCIFATKHRKCEDVLSLDDIANSVDKTKVEDTVNCLFETETKVKTAISKYKENAIAIEKAWKEILLSVATEISEAKKRLDNLEIEFKKTFEETMIENGEAVKICSDKHERFLVCLETNRKLLEVIAEKGSLKQIFVTVEKVRNQINTQHEALTDELGNNDRTIQLGFIIEDAVKQIRSIRSIGFPQVMLQKVGHIAEIDKSLQKLKDVCSIVEIPQKESDCEANIEKDPLFLVDAFDLKAEEVLKITTPGCIRAALSGRW